MALGEQVREKVRDCKPVGGQASRREWASSRECEPIGGRVSAEEFWQLLESVWASPIECEIVRANGQESECEKVWVSSSAVRGCIVFSLLLSDLSCMYR